MSKSTKNRHLGVKYRRWPKWPIFGWKNIFRKKISEKNKTIGKLGGVFRTHFNVHMTPEKFSDWYPDSSLNDIFRHPSNLFYLDFLQRSYEGEYGSKIDFDDNVAANRVRTSRETTRDTSLTAITRHPLSGCEVDLICIEDPKNNKMDAKYQCKHFDVI